MKKMLSALGIAGMLAIPAVAFGDAKADWNKMCKSCHGEDGKGKTKMGEKLQVKDFSAPDFQKALTDKKALDAITNGVKDEKTGKDKMKGYKDKLSEDQAKELVKYIRSLAAK